MVLGHHVFKHSFKNMQNTNGTARLQCQIFNVFLSYWATEGMAPNPEPFGLLWNEKFVQLLEAVGTRNMQCRLRSTQGWAAFCM